MKIKGRVSLFLRFSHAPYEPDRKTQSQTENRYRRSQKKMICNCATPPSLVRSAGEPFTNPQYSPCGALAEEGQSDARPKKVKTRRGLDHPYDGCAIAEGKLPCFRVLVIEFSFLGLRNEGPDANNRRPHSRENDVKANYYYYNGFSKD